MLEGFYLFMTRNSHNLPVLGSPSLQLTDCCRSETIVCIPLQSKSFTDLRNDFGNSVDTNMGGFEPKLEAFFKKTDFLFPAIF